MLRLIAMIILIGQVHALGAVTSIRSIRQDIELLSGRYLVPSCEVDDLCYGSATTSLIPPNMARRAAAEGLFSVPRVSSATASSTAKGLRPGVTAASPIGKKSVADILYRNSSINPTSTV